MWMHAECAMAIVPKHDTDGIADDGVDDGAKKPEMLPLWRPLSEVSGKLLSVYSR